MLPGVDPGLTPGPPPINPSASHTSLPIGTQDGYDYCVRFESGGDGGYTPYQPVGPCVVALRGRFPSLSPWMIFGFQVSISLTYPFFNLRIAA